MISLYTIPIFLLIPIVSSNQIPGCMNMNYCQNGLNIGYEPCYCSYSGLAINVGQSCTNSTNQYNHNICHINERNNEYCFCHTVHTFIAPQTICNDELRTYWKYYQQLANQDQFNPMYYYVRNLPLPYYGPSSCYGINHSNQGNPVPPTGTAVPNASFPNPGTVVPNPPFPNPGTVVPNPPFPNPGTVVPNPPFPNPGTVVPNPPFPNPGTVVPNPSFPNPGTVVPNPPFPNPGTVVPNPPFPNPGTVVPNPPFPNPGTVVPNPPFPNPGTVVPPSQQPNPAYPNPPSPSPIPPSSVPSDSPSSKSSSCVIGETSSSSCYCPTLGKIIEGGLKCDKRAPKKERCNAGEPNPSDESCYCESKNIRINKGEICPHSDD